MGSRWDSVVIDAHDPGRLARWWAEVLGLRVTAENDDEATVGGNGGPDLVFGKGDDPRTGKNRLHLDLRPDNQEAEVERLVNMGARHVDIGQREVPWVVLADPEGNEFCVLREA